MDKEKLALGFALGQIFCDEVTAEKWMSFSDEEIEDFVDDLTVWQPFENYGFPQLLSEVETQTDIALDFINRTLKAKSEEDEFEVWFNNAKFLTIDYALYVEGREDDNEDPVDWVEWLKEEYDRYKDES